MKKKWFRIVIIAVMVSLMSQTIVAFAAEKEIPRQFVKFTYVPDDAYTDDDCVSGSWYVSGDAEVTYGKIAITYDDKKLFLYDADIECCDALKGMTVFILKKYERCRRSYVYEKR